MPAIDRKYCCENCGALFTERELICEDWRDPKKSIICPKCMHYLEVPFNWKSKYAIIITVLAIILGIALTIINGFAGRPLFVTLFFIALPAWLWAYGDPFSPIKTKSMGKSKI